MNEQAIKDAHAAFTTAGYTKSIEEFNLLMASNPQAVADAHETFKGAGYTKSLEDFQILMGLEPGKANVQSAGAAVNENEAPGQNESENGSPKYFEFNKKLGRLEPTAALMRLTEEEAILKLEETYPSLKGHISESGWGDNIILPYFMDSEKYGKGESKRTIKFDNWEGEVAQSLIDLKKVLASNPAISGDKTFGPGFVADSNATPHSVSQEANDALKNIEEVASGEGHQSTINKDLTDSALDEIGVGAWDSYWEVAKKIVTETTNVAGTSGHAVSDLESKSPIRLKSDVVKEITNVLFDKNPTLYPTIEEAEKVASRFADGALPVEEIKKHFGISDLDISSAEAHGKKRAANDVIAKINDPAVQSEVTAQMSDEAEGTTAYTEEFKRRVQDGEDYFRVYGQELKSTIEADGRTFVPVVSFSSKNMEKSGVATSYDNVNKESNPTAINKASAQLNGEMITWNEKADRLESLGAEAKYLADNNSGTEAERQLYNAKVEEHTALYTELTGDAGRIATGIEELDKNTDDYLARLAKRKDVQPYLNALKKNYDYKTQVENRIVDGIVNPAFELMGWPFPDGYLHNTMLDVAERREEQSKKYAPERISVEASWAWTKQASADMTPTIAAIAAAVLTKGASKKISALGQAASLTTFGVMGAGGDSLKNRLRRKQAVDYIPTLEKRYSEETDPELRKLIWGQLEDTKRVAGMSQWEIGVSAIIHGASEIIFERLGTMQILKMGPEMAALVRSGGIKSTLAAGGMGVKGLGIENIEESFTEMTNNFVDIHWLGDDKSIFEGMDKDFFANNTFTALVLQGPSVARGVHASITDEVTSALARGEHKKLLKELKARDERAKTMKPNSKELREFNEETEEIIRSGKLVQDAEIGHFMGLEHDARVAWIKNSGKTNGYQRKARELGEASAKAKLEGDFVTVKKIEKELAALKVKLTASHQTGDNIMSESAKERKAIRQKQKRRGSQASMSEEINEAEYHFSSGITMYNQALTRMASKGFGRSFIEVDENTTREELVKAYGAEIADQVLEDMADGTKTAKLIGRKHLVVYLNTIAEQVLKLEMEGKHLTDPVDQAYNRKKINRATLSGLHELLHSYHIGRIIDNETLDLDKEVGALIGEAQKAAIEQGDQSVIKVLDAIRSRYATQGADVVLEELMQAMAEMQLSGTLNVGNQSEMYHYKAFGHRLVNQAVDALNMIPGANISGTEFAHITSIDDVANYIEGFRRALVNQRVKLNSVDDDSERSSLGLSEEIQAIYDEKGIDGAWEITALNKGLAITKTLKYSKIPTFSNTGMQELFVDEILYSKRGIHGLVTSYNPDLGVPLSAYINSQLTNRVKGIARDLFGADFMKNIDDEKGLAADPHTDVASVKDQDAPKISSIIRRKLRLDEKQMNIVRRAAVRALATAPNIQAVVKGKPKAFYDHLSKTFNTLLFKMVKNHMGTGSMYRMWAKQNFEIFDKHLPISALVNGQMDLFYKPVMGENGKQERMSVLEANEAGIPMDKAGAGPAKWVRVHPTIEDFFDWVMAKGMAPTTKGARKTTMARLLAREVGLDAVMETLSNTAQQEYNEDGTEIEGKTVNVLEHVVAANGGDMARTAVVGMVSVHTDRHPGTLFSSALDNPRSLTGTQEAAIAHRKGKAFYRVDTGSPAMNMAVRNLISWLELNGWYELKDDKMLTMLLNEAEGFKKLFDEATRIYNNGNVKLLKKRLKDPASINKFILGHIRLGMEQQTIARLMGTVSITNKEDILALITKTFTTLKWGDDAVTPKEREGKLSPEDAIKYIFRMYQPMAHLGKKSVFRGNEKFYTEVILPLIKSYPGLTEKVQLVDSKIVDKKTKKPFKTFAWVENGIATKITPPGALDQNDPVFNSMIKGKLTTERLEAFNKQAIQTQNDMIDILDKLRGELSMAEIATIITAWGSQTRSMGRWGYQLEGIYHSTSRGKTSYTVEHQTPWSDIGSYYALYALGAIDKTTLKAKLKTAKIYLHPTDSATEINKTMKAHDPHSGEENAKGESKRMAEANKGNVYTSGVEMGLQVAKNKKSEMASLALDINDGFNDILEASTGMPAGLMITPSQAIKRGKKAARFLKNQGIMVSAAEDFTGLLYKMLSSGIEGEAQLEWLLGHLVLPYDQAVDNVSRARIRKREQFALIPKPKAVARLLKGEAFDGFNGEDAVRMYIWKLRKADSRTHVKDEYYVKAMSYMASHPTLKAYADAVHAVAGAVAYAPPGKRWAYGSIALDLIGGINGDLRNKELEAWSANVKEVFSEDNLNKLEALYGQNYRQALENILERMRTGRNRTISDNDRTTKWFQGWVSNSVGTIMLLNMRSSVLQLLSTFNYINTSDNNPIKAILRLINTPQYVKDMRFIMSSPFLKDRTAGMRLDVNEEDIVLAEREATDIFTKALKILLNKGFMPTRLMDAAAITVGGAGFYRNRANTYVSQGMTIEAAEKLAFEDFRRTTISSQQSSDPRMVSQQQASTLGRLILQFGNTPGQYMRIQLKAMKDIINGRGSVKKHIATIAYYGILQNAVFTMLQQALWAAWFDDDDEWAWTEEGRSVTDGMISSMLRGVGIYGAAIDTLIRVLKVKAKEDAKGWKGSNEKIVLQFLSISPGIGSMARKVNNGLNVKKWRDDDYGVDPWSLHSPEVEEAAWMLEGTVNIPAKRILDKVHNLESIMSRQNEVWQDLALFWGWKGWQLGVEEIEMGEENRESKEKRSKNATEKESPADFIKRSNQAQ